jgi:hypothetical protein
MAARLEIGPIDEGANKTDSNNDNDNDNRIIHARSKYRPQKQHEEPGRAIFVHAGGHHLLHKEPHVGLVSAGFSGEACRLRPLHQRIFAGCLGQHSLTL